MKPRPRIRKTIKWVSAAVTVLLVGAWLQSGWCMNLWNSGGRGVTFWHGGVTVVYRQDPQHPPWEWTSSRTVQSPAAFFGGGMSWKMYNGQWLVEAPVWPLPILFGIAAVAAWRLDVLACRRERRGRCRKCNYDRAGIAGDAKCPECGVVPQVG